MAVVCKLSYSAPCKAEEVGPLPAAFPNSLPDQTNCLPGNRVKSTEYRVNIDPNPLLSTYASCFLSKPYVTTNITKFLAFGLEIKQTRHVKWLIWHVPFRKSRYSATECPHFPGVQKYLDKLTIVNIKVFITLNTVTSGIASGPLI